jgi:hypothetical protein
MIPEFIDIKEACRIIGGNRPIHPSTYWRGVKAGRFPAPEELTPGGVKRIDLGKLSASIRARLAGHDPVAA